MWARTEKRSRPSGLWAKAAPTIPTFNLSRDTRFLPLYGPNTFLAQVAA
jgi:hypothetical protein